MTVLISTLAFRSKGRSAVMVIASLNIVIEARDAV